MNVGFSPACLALAALIADKPRNDQNMFKSVTELLEAYPEWKRPEDDKWDEKYWKDLMKAATPKGLKAKLCFNTELLLKLVEAELIKLLSFRNVIKHILSFVEPKGNKKLILELTACLSGMPTTFITGGGMTLATQRVIYLYEREGSVTCTRRRRRTITDEDGIPLPKRTYYDPAGVRGVNANNVTPSSSAAAAAAAAAAVALSGLTSPHSSSSTPQLQLPAYPVSLGKYCSPAAHAASLGGLLTAAKLPLMTSTPSTALMPSLLPHCPSGDAVVPRYDFPLGSAAAAGSTTLPSSSSSISSSYGMSSSSGGSYFLSGGGSISISSSFSSSNSSSSAIPLDGFVSYSLAAGLASIDKSGGVSAVVNRPEIKTEVKTEPGVSSSITGTINATSTTSTLGGFGGGPSMLSGDSSAAATAAAASLLHQSYLYNPPPPPSLYSTTSSSSSSSSGSGDKGVGSSSSILHTASGISPYLTNGLVYGGKGSGALLSSSKINRMNTTTASARTSGSSFTTTTSSSGSSGTASLLGAAAAAVTVADDFGDEEDMYRCSMILAGIGRSSNGLY